MRGLSRQEHRVLRTRLRGKEDAVDGVEIEVAREEVVEGAEVADRTLRDRKVAQGSQAVRSVLQCARKDDDGHVCIGIG